MPPRGPATLGSGAPQFLSPSTAPSPSRPSAPRQVRPGGNKPVRPVRRGRQTIIRPITADGRTALELRRLTPQIKRGVGRAVFPNEDKDDGGVFGAITAPFRLGGGLVLNASKELSQSIPGFGRLVYENAKDLGQMALSPLPGITFDPAAKRFADRTIATSQGMVEDFKYSFGPLVKGDVGEFARRFYNEPLRVGGTVALAYSGTGAAVGAGLRGAGAATGSRALTRAGSKRISVRPGEEAPLRYREPELLAPSRDRYGREAVPQAKPVERNLRPRSKNVITREIQRNITDPLIGKIKVAVGNRDLTTRGGTRLNPYSASARYERAARKGFRNDAFGFLEETDQFLGQTTRTLTRLVRRATSKTRGAPGAASSRKGRADQAYYTAAIRAMGLNNLSSTKQSRTWGRDSLIRQYESSLSRSENPAYSDMIERNLAGLRSVPDEWLDPATAPKYINDLTKEMENTLARSTELKVKTGVVSQQTAAVSGRRAQEAAAGVFDQARAMRTAMANQRRAASKIVVARGRISGIESQIAALRTQMSASNNPDALRPRLEALQRQLSGERRSLGQAVKTERDNRMIADKQRGVVDAALGDMAPGQYFPNYRQKQTGMKKTKTGRAVLGSSPRATIPPEKMNEGVIIREGTMAFTPDITMAAIRNAADVAGRAKALSSAIETYVVRGEDGKPITDDKAVNIAENSSGLYVAKSKKELMKILSADSGLGMEQGFGFRRKVDPNEESALLAEMDQMPNGDKKYLIPSAAEKGWQDALATRQNLIDELNQYFKAGVLALSPRWYVQNGFGMSLQFFLGAGADLKAIVTAGLNPTLLFSKAKREAQRAINARVSSEIAESGLATDLGQYARKAAGQKTFNPLKKLVIAGYRFNAALEAIPRRAMYWHSVKRRLREEDMLRGMSDEATLMEAWDGVSQAAKRGERWANDLIDDVVLNTERFMGNYTRYNKFERVILRRVFPFYGWMRAIHRLAFTLPFKHPKRAALLNAASQMAYQMYGDEEASLITPYAGFITGENDDVFVQTNIANPFASLGPTVDFAAEAGSTFMREGPLSAASKIPAELIQNMYSQVTPVFTDIPEIALGRSALNVPVPFSPGADDVYLDPRTKRPIGLNPVTGNVEYKTPRAAVEQALGTNVPAYNLVRKLIAGQQPTADASLNEIIRWRLGGRDPSEAYRFVQTERPEGRTYTRSTKTDLLGALVGVPVGKYSSVNAIMDQARLQKMFLDAYRNQINKRFEAEALYGIGNP